MSGADRRAYRGDAGFDLFYNVTPELRANFTLNTDFAETEVDNRRVNLTRFPLRFPEKRDFFLDGSNFFDFSATGVTPFFSRRIGLDTEGNPQRIVYGVKLTGQAGAYDIGVLQVRTADSGNIPGEDFSVVRLKRRFLSESHVATLYTRRGEAGTGAAVLHTAGAEFHLSTSRFRGDRNLSLTGFYLWNNTPEGGGRGGARGFRVHYPERHLAVSAVGPRASREFQPGRGIHATPRFPAGEPGAVLRASAPRPSLDPTVQVWFRLPVPDGHKKPSGHAHS